MRSKKQKKKEISSKNKIGLTVLSILIFISALLLGCLCIIYVDLKNTNNNIKSDISNIKEEILDIDDTYISLTDELNNKKNELKDKIEEYSIWQEMIEKVK